LTESASKGDDNMTRPKISICIPTYNYAEYIGQAIDSVLMQDYVDYELIIIDDCSSDTTCDVVNAYLKKGDPRISLVVNETNRGLVGNWNYSLELAKGEYIKFLFADDYFIESDALRVMSAHLDANPAISLVSTTRTVVDKHSVPQKLLTHFDADCSVSGTAVIEECLSCMVNLIGEPSAVMFRKSQASRGFNPAYKQLVDLEMWFHLLEQGDYAYICRSLCSFRIHDKQQTAVNRKDPGMILETGWLHQEYLDKAYISISPFRRFYVCYDYRYKFWKNFKNNPAEIEKHLYVSTSEKIKFFFLLSFYKAVKPFVKLTRRKEYRTLKKRGIDNKG
jgi:glycosyltransferase involved in cell wall biosynthesis